MRSTRSTTREEEDDDVIEVTSDKEVTDSDDESEEAEHESDNESESNSNSAEDSASDEDSDESDASSQRGQLRFKTNKPEPSKSPTPTLQSPIHYRPRRLALTVKIPEVDSNQDCLFKIAATVNDFLKQAKKKNKHFRLRRFDDLSQPDPKQRTTWLTKVSNSSATDFMTYVYGYFPSANPRGGMFRLRINAVMDSASPLPRFLKDIMHDWGHNSNFLADLKAQSIWDPIKIGYLMRAPRFLTHSYELLDALEESPQSTKHKIHFGISWATIPSPVGGYDKETAVQAVMIETNKSDVHKAVSLLKKWYPLNPKTKANPPYPGNFRFVLNRDNEAIEGNPVAKKHLSTLMTRQGIFNKMTKGAQSYGIQSLANTWKEGSTQTVRDKLLETKIVTSKDKDLQGGPLFQTISTSTNNQTGQKSTWFTFHQAIETEAISVVKNLPIFMQTEWNIDPHDVCYEQFVMEGEEWDTVNRVAQNEDTKELALAAEVYTQDLQDDEIQDTEDEAQSLTSRARREMKRTLYGDEETVISISKSQPKKPRNTPMAIDVQDTTSQGGISGVSGTSSRTSVLRERFQKEFHEQEEKLEQMESDRNRETEKAELLQQQVNKMQAMMAQMQAQIKQSITQENQPNQLGVEQPQISTAYSSPRATVMQHIPDASHTEVTPITRHQPHPAEVEVPIEDILPCNLTASLQDIPSDDQLEPSFDELYTMIYNGMITQEMTPPDPDKQEEIKFIAQEEANRLCNPSFDSSHTLLEAVHQREDRREKLAETERELSELEKSSEMAEPTHENMDRDSDGDYRPDSPRGEKRLAVTKSTESDDQAEQFLATSSKQLKKKFNAPGDADPGFHC